jgi:membrane associated rhomboid family serine protease
MPERRSMFGGRIPAKLYVTYGIIGLCVASFALQWITQGRWTQMFAFSPFIGATQPWRFLTAAFLHSTGFIGHILFNMMAFYQCGQILERALGHARFATLCLLTALGGSVGFLLLAQGPLVQGGGWYTPVVGASGIVFGLFGALIPVLKRAGSSVRSILGLIAINAVLGFVVPGIAWQAHLGGFAVGLAMGYAYAHAPSLLGRMFGGRRAGGVGAGARGLRSGSGIGVSGPGSAGGPYTPGVVAGAGGSYVSGPVGGPYAAGALGPGSPSGSSGVVGPYTASGAGGDAASALPLEESGMIAGQASAQVVTVGSTATQTPIKAAVSRNTALSKAVAWGLPIAVLALLTLAAFLRYDTSGWLALIRSA